jgi:LemA protein
MDQGGLEVGVARAPIAVSASYPTLKANEGFRELQAQLEGTENRIAVARGRYIEAVRGYHVTARSFPSNLTAEAFGYSDKANFTVDNEKALAAPPVVDLGGSAQSPGAASQAGK